MKRVLAAIKIDIINQWRNGLYAVGLGVGLLVAVMMAWLAPSEWMPQIAPAIVLAVVGGSTLMYVGAMLLFERDERTMFAQLTSPLRVGEYLGAKIVSLAILATLESLEIVAGTHVLKSLFTSTTTPSWPPVVLGLLLLAIMYVLLGVILIVRFRSLNEFLIPMAVVAVVGQIPILYFLDWVPANLMLLIPTSGPAMLVRGGYLAISNQKWIYAVCYSVIAIVILARWARAAFQMHVVERAGQ